MQVRALNIIRAVTDVGFEEAKQKLEEADGHIKLAIVMIILNISKDKAKTVLEKIRENP